MWTAIISAIGSIVGGGFTYMASAANAVVGRMAVISQTNAATGSSTKRTQTLNLIIIAVIFIAIIIAVILRKKK
jgi:hypothetical protein